MNSITIMNDSSIIVYQDQTKGHDMFTTPARRVHAHQQAIVLVQHRATSSLPSPLVIAINNTAVEPIGASSAYKYQYSSSKYIIRVLVRGVSLYSYIQQ